MPEPSFPMHVVVSEGIKQAEEADARADAKQCAADADHQARRLAAEAPVPSAE